VLHRKNTRPAFGAAAISLLGVEGAATANITLMGNDLGRLQRVIDKGPGVTGGTVTLLGNRLRNPASP
jgi:hypothetical protein